MLQLLTLLPNAVQYQDIEMLQGCLDFAPGKCLVNCGGHLPIIDRVRHVCSTYNIRVKWRPRSMNSLAHKLANFVRYSKLGWSCDAFFYKLLSLM